MSARAAPRAKRAAKSAPCCGRTSKAAPRRSSRRQPTRAPAVGVLQPKLRVSDPNDQFEREADHVADRVMNMPGPASRMKDKRRGAEEEEKKSSLQRRTMEEETGAATEEEAAQTFSLQRREEAREEEEAQTFSLQRQEETATEDEEAQTFALQREMGADEEVARTASLQRREMEEEETPAASMQRRTMEEDTAGAEEEAQTFSLQRQEDEAAEEEEAQTFSLQRQEDEAAEEEEAQTFSLQRQEDEAAEEEEAQTFSLQRQEDEAAEEEEAQTFSLQRQEDEAAEEEQAQTSSLQRRKGEEEDEQMQSRARRPRRHPRISPQFETYLRLMRRGGGQPLPDPLRSFLEPRFKRNLGDVRVHTGPRAAQLARKANARAFTVGKHIVFGSGEYRPASDQGRRLIAHELTHVLQQRGGLHSVQREVLHPEAAEPETDRSAAATLERFRDLFQIKRSVVSPTVLNLVEELLRHALRSELGEALMALIEETEASTVKRTIEAGGYTLDFKVNRRGGAGAAQWSIARKDTEQTFFAHTRELPLQGGEAGGEAPGLLDEERLNVTTALASQFDIAEPPVVEAAPPSVQAPETPVASALPLETSPATKAPRTAKPPTEIKSDALASADATPDIETQPASEAGSGKTAGKDDPAMTRPPVDEDPDAEQVPEEPSAEEVAKEVTVRRKAASRGRAPQPTAGVSAEVNRVTASGGKPLPVSSRRFLEPRFGVELTRVRLHTDARAARVARSLGAKAFTRGEHIVFGDGQCQPETDEGQRLIAHEVSHVLQQRNEGRGTGLLQRQEDDCPPPDPVPEVEVVSSPASPGEDPAFQKTKNRVDNRAENQSQHGPGEEKSESANAAAEVKEGEKQSHAQTDQVGKMDAEAQNPPAFDKEAFVAKVLEQVEQIKPGTLDDVFKFDDRGKAGEVKDAVTGQVEESQENSQGPLEEAATADPGEGESPRVAGELEIEEPGAEPGSVRADRAMPPPRTDSEIDMSAETVQTENILKEACVTREFMEEHDDPVLKDGIAAQDEVKTASETAPENYRGEEAEALSGARAGASGAGAAGVEGMFGERGEKFAAVAAEQQKTKTDNEIKRDKAAEEINGIFTSTQTKVQDRLTQLDTDVMTTFDTEANAATARFESFVRTNAEKYKKSWFDTAVEWLEEALFDEPPAEVWDFYSAGLETFHSDMRAVIVSIADVVDTGLKDARKLVEDGKAEVQKKLDGLGTDLEDFKQQISDQMNDKFRGLEASIVQKQADLVKGLAERYVKANDKVKEIGARVREEYKNILEKAADVYHAVKDAVVGWIEKLAAVVGNAAKRIIKKPGQFLKNLGAGIIQGLTMFIDNIGENIKAAVVQWLTGNLAGAGVTLPTTFDAKGIIGFLLELVGLGIANIKEIARKVFGAPVVALIEKGVEGAEKIKQIFDILVSEGPAGLFKFLAGEFEKMKEQVLGEAGKAIAEGLVIAGIKKVLGIISGLVSGGVGTVITIVLTIIDVILWFRDNAAQLAELVSTIAGTVVSILEGQVGVVANAINTLLKRLLPLVLSFVGALVGIGGVVSKIQKIFKAIKKPATKIITALFQKLKKTIKKLLGKVRKKARAKKKKKGKKLLSSKQVVSRVLREMKRPTKADTPAAALSEKKAQAASLIGKYQPQLKKGTLKIAILDTNAGDVEKNSAVDFDVAASPGRKAKAPVPLDVEDENAVQQRFSRARTLKKFTGEKGFTLADWAGTFTDLTKGTHQKDLRYGTSNKIIQKKKGKYHFKGEVDRDEVIERGALEIQNNGRSVFPKGRFGIPILQSFLSGRKIAGIPPETFNDSAIVSATAKRAVQAGAIRKVGKTGTWAWPDKPPVRTLPDSWGGVSHIRPRLYEKGSGFKTLFNTEFAAAVASTITPLVTQQVANIAAAKAKGKTAAQANYDPWDQLIAAELARSNENFRQKGSLKFYTRRARYHIDHVAPLAGHWTAPGIGHNADQGERNAATQGKRGGLKVMEAVLNESKGSGGIEYQKTVGPDFTSPGGDQYHVAPGIPFNEYK
jgi:hypothetical protein